MEPRYISPNPDESIRFFQEKKDKEVVMLNILKYREKADYSDFEDLKPTENLSGQEAYGIYMKTVKPLIEKAGAQVVYFGKAGNFLIGPDSKNWDAVLLVRYPSVEQFVAFSQSDDYKAIAGHRTAALEDSRLMPTYPVM